MNTKNIITIVLVLVLIALGYFNFYFYSGAAKCKATAEDLGAKLQQCATGATACQAALTGLKQVPACAPYITSGK